MHDRRRISDGIDGHYPIFEQDSMIRLSLAAQSDGEMESMVIIRESVTFIHRWQRISGCGISSGKSKVIYVLANVSRNFGDCWWLRVVRQLCKSNHT